MARCDQCGQGNFDKQCDKCGFKKVITKEGPSMTLVYCDTCGCHFSDACPAGHAIIIVDPQKPVKP